LKYSKVGQLLSIRIINPDCVFDLISINPGNLLVDPDFDGRAIALLFFSI